MSFNSLRVSRHYQRFSTSVLYPLLLADEEALELQHARRLLFRRKESLMFSVESKKR